MFNLKKICALGLVLAAQPFASSILTQTPQGSYTSNTLGGSTWTHFTAMMNAQHSITQTADFSNLAQLNNYDAVFVNQELFNTLSGGEISSLQQYLTEGHKVVMIGENSSWHGWNASLEAVVGGSFTDGCNWDLGHPLVNDALTQGVNTVQNACGDQVIANSGNVDILFSNNMAGLYTVGAGQALLIMDSNWNDDSYATYDNNVFAQNVVNWLGTPVAGAVPEPTSIALFGLGIMGMAVAARRKLK